MTPLEPALDPDLPAKCKRIINPKLTSEENAHTDVLKKRQLQEGGPSNKPTRNEAPKLKNQQLKFTKALKAHSRQPSVEDIVDKDFLKCHNTKNPNIIFEAADGSDDDLLESIQKPKGKTKAPKASSRQPSVKEVVDEDSLKRRNAGKPRNPDVILEAADGSDDKDLPKRVPKKIRKVVPSKSESDVEVIGKPKKEMDKDELGKEIFLYQYTHILTAFSFQHASRRTGGLPSMHSSMLKSRSAMIMIGKSTSSPALQDIAREEANTLEASSYKSSLENIWTGLLLD